MSRMRVPTSYSQSSWQGEEPQPNTYAPSLPVPNGNMQNEMRPFCKLASISSEVRMNFIVVASEPSPPMMQTTFLVESFT